jgi:hypothetical protein
MPAIEDRYSTRRTNPHEDYPENSIDLKLGINMGCSGENLIFSKDILNNSEKTREKTIVKPEI